MDQNVGEAGHGRDLDHAAVKSFGEGDRIDLVEMRALADCAEPKRVTARWYPRLARQLDEAKLVFEREALRPVLEEEHAERAVRAREQALDYELHQSWQSSTSD